MISKCANPDCSARLLYLRSGKVIRLDFESPRARPAANTGEYTGTARRAQFFWLCAECSARVSLKLVEGRVTVQPLDQRKPQPTAA